MRPIRDMPDATAAAIDVVLADIDDTLTTEGRLPAASYAALEALQAAGLRVAPVTGRPAGWCDMIARFWPVDGVVGENGAMYFAYDGASRRMRRVYAAGDVERASNQAALDRIRDRVLAEIPGAAVANDQAYREADLAIDFCEDVPPLPDTDIARIKQIFEEEGAIAKISSIHVNGWFGNYDKLTMARLFARDVLDIDLDADRDRVLYAGDSPNDAPMFAHFPNACGVANVRDFKGRIEAEPAWIADARGGEGFAEIAAVLLDARKDQRKSA
ncbi:MAG: HAD-IIB family hydrolase [Pseudomonadota bacterium]